MDEYIRKQCHLTNHEIIATSGPKENNSCIIYMIILSYYSKKKTKGHILLSKYEHMDTINTCRGLKELGFAEYDYFDNPEEQIKSNTCLVFMSSANSDTGSLNPLKPIAQIAEEKNIPLYINYNHTIQYRYPQQSDGYDMFSFYNCLVIDKNLISGYNMQNIISRTPHPKILLPKIIQPTKKYIEFLQYINKFLYVCHYDKFKNMSQYPIEIVILGPPLNVPRLDVLMLCIVDVDVGKIDIDDVVVKTTFNRFIPIKKELKSYMIGFEFYDTKNVENAAKQLLKSIRLQVTALDWKNSLR